MDESMRHIRNWSGSLVGSQRLFDCLRGYMAGEFRLAIGERKGKIGGKRYEKLQEVGFSPKNFTQLFRLSYVGQVFFTENRFPVNLKGEPCYDELMLIKTQPHKFTAAHLINKFHVEEELLKKAYENRISNLEFDEEVANSLLLKVYMPHLQKYYAEIS